ncbi:hypothetical protein AMTRI_Chr10g231220 [Amborella trichopoda]
MGNMERKRNCFGISRVDILANMDCRVNKNRKGGLWSPPLMGCMKINFDGSLVRNLEPAWLGRVIRDHLGNVFLLDFGNFVELIALYYLFFFEIVYCEII